MLAFAQKPQATQETTAKSTLTIGKPAAPQMLPANSEGFEAGSRNTAADAVARDFSRIPVRSRPPVKLQAKLKIEKPGDKYEEEADRVAEQVMRSSEPAAASQLSSTSSAGMSLQRKCACGGSCPGCQSGQQDKPEKLQMKSVNSSSASQRVVPPIVHEVLGSPGQPLDSSTRDFMQSRFGHDFGQVRVHADARAGDSARAVGARAYTVGRNVVFAPQEYAPGTAEGRRLLAHELTHTIQQSRGGAEGSLQRKEAVLTPDVTPANPLERLLQGDSDGLTTPFVNTIQITDSDKLDDALPSAFSYGAGSAANTCKVAKPIDVNSQAKIITASAPGAKGWTATAPFATVKDVLGIADKSCAAKKDKINVRMVATIGNEKYQKLVRTAEGDHEAVLTANHNKYLKPYHDLVNSKQGSNTDLKKCAEGLSKELRDKEVDAINGWVTDWQASIKKFDGDGGPHNDKASAAVVGNCDEVLVTIRR
jgi:Domain of unknown function (DUF4157)